MKLEFAIVAGQKREAAPGLRGACPCCGAPLIARCGKIRIWHWAHLGALVCDRWWENQTEWHKAWKNAFPRAWHEIIHTAPDREKHIADVKTETGMVIEFQHSFLKPEEHAAREAFYGKMIWVVDGTRHKNDAAQLLEGIRPYVQGQPPFILFVARHENGALLRDWNASLAPAYFDLGDRQEGGQQILWRRDPIRRNGQVYLTPVPRDVFLKVHREGLEWDEQLSKGIEQIVEEIQRAARRPSPLPMPPPPPPPGFRR